jgi:hypothetical protein
VARRVRIASGIILLIRLGLGVRLATYIRWIEMNWEGTEDESIGIMITVIHVYGSMHTRGMQ